MVYVWQEGMIPELVQLSAAKELGGSAIFDFCLFSSFSGEKAQHDWTILGYSWTILHPHFYRLNSGKG